MFKILLKEAPLTYTASGFFFCFRSENFLFKENEKLKVIKTEKCEEMNKGGRKSKC